MPQARITEADLAYALAQLPDGWFEGRLQFRRIAIALYNYQAHAEPLLTALLRRGDLEAVAYWQGRWKRYRYRKVRKES